MRVALVVPGGVDRSGEYRVIPALVALVKQLASRGEVHVFAFHQEAAPGEWLLHGAHVHNIGEGFTRLRCVEAIVREHKAKPFDVVHAVFSGSCGLVAVVAAWIAGTRSVVHVAGVELVALRDIDYGGAQRLSSRLRERWVLRKATVVTAASAPMLAQIQAFGVSALRVPLGVDLTAWPCRVPAPRDPGEPARLIHVASLNRRKGPAHVVACDGRTRGKRCRFSPRCRRRGHARRCRSVAGPGAWSGIENHVSWLPEPTPGACADDARAYQPGEFASRGRPGSRARSRRGRRTDGGYGSRAHRRVGARCRRGGARGRFDATCRRRHAAPVGRRTATSTRK